MAGCAGFLDTGEEIKRNRAVVEGEQYRGRDRDATGRRLREEPTTLLDGL